MIRAVSLAALLLLGGCASTLTGGEIAQSSEAVAAVGGLPYRERLRVRVEVYQLTDKGYVAVGSSVETLADPTRLHFLNFNGQMLANTNAKFEQRTDGSLATVHLAGKQQFSAAVTAAGDAVKGYGETRAANDKAREDREKAATTLADAAVVTTEQQGDTAVDLRYRALEAEAKLEELPATAKRSEVIAAERNAVEAKRAANRAAEKAGQNKPFPDV